MAPALPPFSLLVTRVCTRKFMQPCLIADVDQINQNAFGPRVRVLPPAPFILHHDVNRLALVE